MYKLHPILYNRTTHQKQNMDCFNFRSQIISSQIVASPQIKSKPRWTQQTDSKDTNETKNAPLHSIRECVCVLTNYFVVFNTLSITNLLIILHNILKV